MKRQKRIASLALVLLTCTSGAFAAEVVRCEEIDSNNPKPAVITIGSKRSPGMPREVTALGAAIKSPTRHLNYTTTVRRSFRGGYLTYKDFLDAKSFNLMIKLAPGANSNLNATLTIDEGRVTERKIAALSCSVENLPPPPTTACANWSTKEKNNALIAAAKNGSPEWLDTVLECGADANFKDAAGCTALLYVTDLACGYVPATRNGHPADPNSQQSPILSSRGFLEIDELINTLVDHGAMIEVRDPANQETPLHKAVKYGHTSLVDLFTGLEADINAQDAQGFSPIMTAADRGNEMMVLTVLDGKPDLTLTNKKGKTAYQIAEAHGFTELLELLTPAAVSETVKGNEDGSCSPTMVHLMEGKTVDIILEPSKKKMFLLTAPALGLELMAMPGESVKQTITPTRTGTFPFTCGVHGAPDNQQTKGSFMVM